MMDADKTARFAETRRDYCNDQCKMDPFTDCSTRSRQRRPSTVMRALVAGIHVFCGASLRPRAHAGNAKQRFCPPDVLLNWHDFTRNRVERPAFKPPGCRHDRNLLPPLRVRHTSLWNAGTMTNCSAAG